MLKELQELLVKTHKEAEDIRLKYEGKVQDMPADEFERWEKAINDADAIQKKIDLAKKSEATHKWLNTEADTVPHLGLEKDLKWQTADDDELKKAWGQLHAGKMTKGEFLAHKAVTKAFSAGSMPGGGAFVLPLVLANDVIRLAEYDVFIRQYARHYTLTNAESLGIVTVGDMNDFDWTTELATGSDDDTEPFGRRELSPKPCAKRVKVSRKLLRMTQDPVGELTKLMSYIRSRTEEKAFLTGDGVTKPLGIFTASTEGISTGRDQATGSANTIAADDFIKGVALMKGNYRNGARWLIHRNTEGRARLFKDSTNNYIWSPFGGVGKTLEAGFSPTIVGFPYDVSEFMTDPTIATSITTGTYVAALANYGMGYAIADALTMEMIPLNEESALTNQIRYVYRFETDAMPVDEQAFVRLKVS